MKLTDGQVADLRSKHGWAKETIRTIEAEVLRLNGGGEAVAWRTEAAKWLRRKAEDQQRTNEQYPAHVKAYPSWEQRVLWLTWLAQDLEAEQEAAPHGLEPWQVDTQPQQAAPGAVVEGFVLMPKETIAAAIDKLNRYRKQHSGEYIGGVEFTQLIAMLSAAPKPQGE